MQIQALQQSAASGQLIIMAGAGTSLSLADDTQPAKNWKELIAGGLDFARIKGKLSDDQFSRWNQAINSSDIDDLLAAAEFISSKLRGLDDVLYNTWFLNEFKRMKFKNGAFSESFKLICKSGTPICTLNYDSLIEQATKLKSINYTDHNSAMSWARREDQGILHLHGIWTEPGSCILGIRDYERSTEDSFRKALQRSLTSLNSFLFIGCGDTFRDPNFTALLAWFRKVMRESGPRHFALVQDNQVAERHADPLWHGFVEPIGYGSSYEDLPPFLDKVFRRNSTTKGRSTKIGVRVEPFVLRAYREYILKDCGQMTIEGVRADMETAQRKFDLERLFVPLTVEAVPPEIPDNDPQRTEKIEKWKRKHPKPIAFGVALAKHRGLALLALPGGGKTLLLKRLAVAYADKSRMALSNDDLPDIDLFPVMIRCREWRDHITKPIDSLLDSFPEIVGQSKLKGFSKALRPLLKSGGVLLLIDGLDEIHDDADRTIFVENLERFVGENPKIHFVASSREAGFSLVAPCLVRFCERWRIAPLSERAISALSSHWHELMGGTSQATSDEAHSVTKTLLRSSALRRLAENPLLLTMLLVVKHAAGRLPPDRVSLYDRAVEVLLDTWNIKGHEALNPREAVPQLSYVAFELMRTGRQTATERELLKIIEECRQNVPMIRRYTKDAPHEFLRRVELRSSLLVEAGHQAEAGRTVPFYQFRHLTFQEYLAAVAAVEGHHPGYSAGQTLLEPLGDFVVADEWKEVIPMAVVLGKKQSQPLISELIRRGEAIKQEFIDTGGFNGKDIWIQSRKLPPSISRLVQCLIEEAEFSQESLARTLPLVSFFARGCQGDENWQALSRGPYAFELIQQALGMYVEMKWPRETWLRNTVALLSAHSRPANERLDEKGVELLRASITKGDQKNVSLALLTICGLIWLRSDNVVKDCLPLVSQIEECVFSSYDHVIESSFWALGFIHSRAHGEGITINPPPARVLDHLVSAWFRASPAPESVYSFVLTSVLPFPRGEWCPHLTEAERKILRSYLHYEAGGVDRSDLNAVTAAAFVGFHAHDVFSEREFLSLIKHYSPARRTRVSAWLEGIGFSWDDAKNEWALQRKKLERVVAKRSRSSIPD